VVGLEDRKCAGPVALGAAESQYRVRGPGRGRRQLQRLLRDHHGGDRIVGALRLDEQAAQAQQPCVLTLGHGAEGALRRIAVAVELRRLRVQQQRQRILRRVTPRRFGMGAGGGGIALADREQALRDGMPAARDAFFAAMPADVSRRAPQRAQQIPDDHRRDDGNAEQQREGRHARRGAPGPPCHHDIAGLVGDPCRASAGERDQNEKQNDPDHQKPYGADFYCPGLASAVMASAANWREAASAASRASALSIQDWAAARSAGASVFNSRRASFESLRSAAAVTRATMAPRSVPDASMRCRWTSFSARACNRSIRVVPVVSLFSAAGGVSFGTSVSNSRLRLAAVGTPVAAKPSSGCSAAASGASAFAAASVAVNGSPCRTPRSSKDATTTRRSGASSAFAWALTCSMSVVALRLDCSSASRRAVIADRSMAGAVAPSGVDLTPAI